MGEKTTIPYCDSTLNLQIGCDGCELWNGKVKNCYAGNFVQKHEGSNGWPNKFESPMIFPDRIHELKLWSDLRGVERKDKPWIQANQPRIVFLNDMGDTFSDSLHINWLEPYMTTLKKLPFVFLLLTKRVRRMTSFFEYYGEVPRNFILGTSVTNTYTLRRIRELNKIKTGIKFISFEPLLEAIDVPLKEGGYLDNVQWVAIGGESGKDSRLFQDHWARGILDLCYQKHVSFFMKQKGGNGTDRKERMSDFPKDLQVRHMPDFSRLIPKKKQEILF